MLETEARMEKPTGCPDPYYGLMMSCHKQDPFDRPTFETLKFQLEDYFFGTTEREYQCECVGVSVNVFCFFPENRNLKVTFFYEFHVPNIEKSLLILYCFRKTGDDFISLKCSHDHWRDWLCLDSLRTGLRETNFDKDNLDLFSTKLTGEKCPGKISAEKLQIFEAQTVIVTRQDLSCMSYVGLVLCHVLKMEMFVKTSQIYRSCS